MEIFHFAQRGNKCIGQLWEGKPEAVIAVFERQIALEKQEINIRCCNDAIERIGQLTRGKFRQPMSLRDVKTVLQRMIS